jgi:hypothetical protein
MVGFRRGGGVKGELDSYDMNGPHAGKKVKTTLGVK